MSEHTGEQTVKALEDQWFKLLAILMHRNKQNSVVISAGDIDRFIKAYPNGLPTIVVRENHGVLTLDLMTKEQAEEAVRKYEADRSKRP